MRIKESGNSVIVEGVRDFNLAQIFDCGQCFRWEKDGSGRYFGTAGGKTAVMEYDEETEVLTVSGSSREEFQDTWRDYLDLDRDYSHIKKELADKDPVIARAIEYGYGIRILNQDKWETLVSFIISQNNNIPRIKKCINSLAETLGTPVGEHEGNTVYDLPSPRRLAEADEEALSPCRLGYRTKYLIETARQVEEEGLDSLEALGSKDVSSEEAFETLKKYSGVGPKVADCIALFSMGKTDRFPIDVWVKKVMNRLYGIDENDVRTMAAFARENFGRYGGIAQQYLFYYITHNKDVQ